LGSHPLECCSSENSGTITVNRGKRTGKLRLFAKSQHFTGRIFLRTGTNTQEGDYPGLTLRLINQAQGPHDQLRVLEQDHEEPD
jgi:hypothetical protein